MSILDGLERKEQKKINIRKMTNHLQKNRARARKRMDMEEDKAHYLLVKDLTELLEEAKAGEYSWRAFK